MSTSSGLTLEMSPSIPACSGSSVGRNERLRYQLDRSYGATTVICGTAHSTVLSDLPKLKPTHRPQPGGGPTLAPPALLPTCAPAQDAKRGDSAERTCKLDCGAEASAALCQQPSFNDIADCIPGLILSGCSS